jgi:hypothetical protein
MNKIKMGDFPENDEITLEKLNATYIQKGDCGMSGDDFNDIKISTFDGGGGIYYVLETERWAFNDVDELIKLLNDFKERCSITVDNKDTIT